MRITRVLFKQNQWRNQKLIWQLQSKRTIPKTNAENALIENNIAIVDANEVAAVQLIPPETEFKVPGEGPVHPQPGATTHPDYHEERILCYKDSDVLLEGLQQAKVLTNTIQPGSGEHLPEQLTNLIDAVSSPNQDSLVQRCIQGSLLYDAEQTKYPIKRKDPARPAWIFPRYYGISDERKNELICRRLLHLCEMISCQSGNHLLEERLVLDDAVFSVPVNWNQSSILLDVRADLVVASKSVLPPLASADTYNNVDLPDIHPLSPVVSLSHTNHYQLEDKFPLKSGPQDLQLHTAFVYHNQAEVVNLYDLPVLESQIMGRTLMKAYAFAVAQARQNYGPQVSGPLPTPVTVQIINTNSQWFHFAVFQLNTCDMHNSTLRNYLWSLPMLNLFSSCSYKEGRPLIEGYDPQIFKTLLAFYNH